MDYLELADPKYSYVLCKNMYVYICKYELGIGNYLINYSFFYMGRSIACIPSIMVDRAT